MARLSPQFMNNLMNMPTNQSMFNLGAAVGGIPGQYKAQQQRKTSQANNVKLMEGIKNRNPAAIYEAARLRNESGDTAGAIKLTEYAKKIQTEQATIENQQKLATFATKAGTKLRDPQVRQAFFMLGKQSNLSVEETDKLYRMFLDQYASNKEIQKAGDLKTRINAEGKYEGYQIVTYKDGTSKEVVFPFPEGAVPASSSSGGNVQQQLRDKIAEEERAAERLALADKMRPGNVLAEETSKVFGKMKVDAALKIPDLRDSTKNISKIITLLRSPDFATGGFTRQVARSFTKFLGTEPANVGEFETRAGEVVLAKLQSFVGAISEGERNFLIEQVGSYLSSGESNIGRLLPLLERAEALLNNSVLVASSSSFESYLEKVLPSAKEEEETSGPTQAEIEAELKRRGLQ